MLLYQASLDRVVSLGDIKDEGNLVAAELEQVVVNVSECIGPLTVMSFRLVDPFLNKLLHMRLTGVDSEPGL